MHTPTILIADGDHLQRQRLEIQLMSRNYEVVSFAKGQEVLEYFQTQSPDLAILAAYLPDINGTDVCDRIKSIKRLRHVPIIIATSQQRYGAVKNLARAVRADLVMPTPIDGRDMFAYLDELLDPASALSTLKSGDHGASSDPHEAEDAAIVERAMQRLENKSARQLEEEQDLRNLLDANQNLHRQLEALRQENSYLKLGAEVSGAADETALARLEEENEALKRRLADTSELDMLRRDYEALEHKYAELETKKSGRVEAPQSASVGTDKEDVERLRRDIEELREMNLVLQVQLEESEELRQEHGALKAQYAELEARADALEAAQIQADTPSATEIELQGQVNALEAQLEASTETLEELKEQNLHLQDELHQLQNKPAEVVYRGEAETLEELESLREQQGVQSKQIETLKKHNKKLLESLSTFQVAEPNRKGLWDKFRL